MPDRKPGPDAQAGAEAPLGPLGSGRDIRALNRDLAGADDAQISRIIAVIDLLPQRGSADQLIEPLRPRLARLNPRRPLRFTRLLFLPLDPLIVPARDWHPDQPTIPRSALGPLAATVRAGLGDVLVALDAMLPAQAWHEPPFIDRAGALLWPRAAALLAAPPPPVGWAETGLSPALYPPLARRIAAVLSHALQLQEHVEEAEAGVTPPRLPIRAMLEDVAQHHREARSMLVTLVLARLPQLTSRLSATGSDPQTETPLRQASEEAAEVLLQKLENAGGAEAVVTSGTLVEAVRAVRRAAEFLNQIGGGSKGAQYRGRLGAIRERLDASCRNRFTHALAGELLMPLQRGSAAVAQLEAAARHLRELESEARVLGGGAEYDTSLRKAAQSVQIRAALSLPERVRLVEILTGPEAALALLA